MKIDEQKQVAFLKKILDKTINKELIWNPEIYNCQAAANLFPYYKLDSEGVFSCTFSNKLEGELWIALCDDGLVHGAITSGYNHMEYFDTTNKEVSILLARIFYSLLDNALYANKLIDDYLDDNQDE